MKNLEMIKKIYLVALLMFTGVFASNANVNLSSFTINPEYLVSGQVSVKNTSVATPIKFGLQFSRTLLPNGNVNSYSDGTATFTLILRTGNLTETPVGTVNVTNADYNGGAFLRVSNATATIPAGISSGYLVLKYTYYNTDQNKQLTVYLEDRIVYIQHTLPSRVPVYQWAGSLTGDYRLGLTEPGSPSKWTSRGIYFYAYNEQYPGTVPVYEFEGHVNDANGEPEFPENVTYYSTSNQTPPALPGLGSGWTTTTPKILFYAFPSQDGASVPVKCYSNPNRSNFLYLATGEISDYYSVINIAFYAYPYGS